MGFIFLHLNSISGLLLELIAEYRAVSWSVCYCSSTRVPDRRKTLGSIRQKIALLEIAAIKATGEA
jgi:hypothetical protein